MFDFSNAREQIKISRRNSIVNIKILKYLIYIGGKILRNRSEYACLLIICELFLVPRTRCSTRLEFEWSYSNSIDRSFCSLPGRFMLVSCDMHVKWENKLKNVSSRSFILWSTTTFYIQKWLSTADTCNNVFVQGYIQNS